MNLKKDNTAYINIEIVVLLIFLMLSISIIYFNFIDEKNALDEELIFSEQFHNEITDYKKNIPIVIRNSINETVEETVKTQKPLDNSETAVKKTVEEDLNEIAKKYQINIKNELIHINSSEDPFNLIFKIKITVEKDNNHYEEFINQEVSIEGFKDPLPFLITRDYPDLTIENDKINYENSLKNFLKDRNVENYQVYENASSPLLIKKCIYDPYVQHGSGVTMKNCVDNGYFHESRDGSCFLCRLEGRETCYHYGFETFITIAREVEENKSACSSDHVIFSNNPYLGNRILFFNYSCLFFENGHAQKYGFVVE